MVAINFPDAPANGDVFVAAGKTWVYVSASTTWTLRTNPTAIPDGGVSTSMLTDGSVTAAKLHSEALTPSITILDGGTPTTLQFYLMGAVDAGVL